jgi:hypothetical protein
MNKNHLANDSNSSCETVAELEKQISELILDCSTTVAEAMAKIAASHQQMKILTDQVFALRLMQLTQPQQSQTKDGEQNG